MIVKAKDEQLQPLQSDHQNSWQLHLYILAANLPAWQQHVECLVPL
jgi:hypothetical protein